MFGILVVGGSDLAEAGNSIVFSLAASVLNRSAGPTGHLQSIVTMPPSSKRLAAVQECQQMLLAGLAHSLCVPSDERCELRATAIEQQESHPK